MGRQIIKQPDGKLCLWSSVVDDFILTDEDKEGIIKFLVAEKAAEISKSVGSVLSKLDKGEKPYHQFTLSYKEALDEIYKRIEVRYETPTT